MRNFTPCVDMVLFSKNALYTYTVLDIEDDTLKCHWMNIATNDSGYCEMSVDYAKKALTTCTLG